MAWFGKEWCGKDVEPLTSYNSPKHVEAPALQPEVFDPHKVASEMKELVVERMSSTAKIIELEEEVARLRRGIVSLRAQYDSVVKMFHEEEDKLKNLCLEASEALDDLMCASYDNGSLEGYDLVKRIKGACGDEPSAAFP